jgi:hypothetical protein
MIFPSSAGFIDSKLFLRSTAVLPLMLASSLPFLPPFVPALFGISGGSACDCLARGFVLSNVCLLGHRTVFVFHRASPVSPTWLGIAMGIAIALVVTNALALERHGVSELLVSALSLLLAFSFSFASSVFIRKQNPEWMKKTVVTEFFCIGLIGWAIALSSMPHFQAHEAIVVIAVAIASGYHTLTYASEIPHLVESARPS